MHSRKCPQNEDPRTNCVPVGLILLGNFAALGLIAWAGYSLIKHPPIPSVVSQGAFRCDHSWRLPCDEVE